MLGQEAGAEAERFEGSLADCVLKGVEDNDNRFFQRLLVEKHGLEKVRVKEVTEASGLVPADSVGIDVDVPQVAHHRKLEVIIVSILISGTAGGLKAVGDLNKQFMKNEEKTHTTTEKTCF